MSAIGAGDAFLAGYLAARYTGRPHADALRFAVACGAESTLHLGAGVLDPRAAERLEHEVEITELEKPRVDATAQVDCLPAPSGKGARKSRKPLVPSDVRCRPPPTAARRFVIPQP